MTTPHGHIASPKTRQANADLTDKQFRHVKRTAASTAGLATAEDAPIGVLQNFPNVGEDCDVAVSGRARFKFGEAVATSPAFLKPNADSLSVACKLAGQRYAGIAHQEGAANAEVDGIAQSGTFCDAVDAKSATALDGAGQMDAATSRYGVYELTGDAGNVQTPDAADIISEFGLTANGQSASALLWNSSANNKTITAGSSVTLFKNEAASDAIMATTEFAEIRYVRTSATTVAALILKFVAV